MDATQWTEEQWEAYEEAEVWIPVILLGKLILAAEAHLLGATVSEAQKKCWKNNAGTALVLLDEIMEVI